MRNEDFSDETGGDQQQRGNLMLRKSSSNIASNFQKEGRHNIVLRGGE